MFKFIDDLSVLQLVLLTGLLTEYNFHEHVASDIGIDQKYLPAVSYPTQDTTNYISNWTDDNLMKLNVAKSNYMIFTRTEEVFATRLNIGNSKLDQVPVSQILGLWISEDLTWTKNCKEICRKGFSRLSMITKLKYVGVGTDDLIQIYILYIRSIAEYCSVAWHSRLTLLQTNKGEKIRKTCLKVILGEMLAMKLP